MEGLIPLVYKAIRGNSTRRKYECLSHGLALEPQMGSGHHSHHQRFRSSPGKMASYHEQNKPEYSSSPEIEMTRRTAYLSKGSKGSRSLRVFTCVTAV